LVFFSLPEVLRVSGRRVRPSVNGSRAKPVIL
jgi:hypothetical protein